MKKKIIIGIVCSILLLSLMVFVIYNYNLPKDIPILGTINEMEKINTEKLNMEKSYDISTFINDDIVKNAENGEIRASLENYYGPANVAKDAKNIAIVSIISLESSSAEFDSVVGRTYGKLLVNTTIKGDLKEGEVIEYASVGGYLTIEEWEKYQFPEANAKRDRLRAESGIKINKKTSYIHLQLKDNIDVEAGKTYLAYFNYNNDMKRYEIIGFQNGLLELDIAKEDNKVARFNLKTNEVRVKNNNTKEFENLEEYITKNIKSVQ